MVNTVRGTFLAFVKRRCLCYTLFFKGWMYFAVCLQTGISLQDNRCALLRKYKIQKLQVLWTTKTSFSFLFLSFSALLFPCFM